MQNYDKLFIALRYYLIGKEYNLALKAFSFAKNYHTGLRKDGVTPEFQHQVEIALYITTLKNLENEELCLTAALLHDVMEDYDIPKAQMVEAFGEKMTDIVWRLTKKYNGHKKPKDEYFYEISQCPVSSIVKGSDRINNVQTMEGVFTIEKQKSYLNEVKERFLPMLKSSKYLYPSQTQAYFNIVHMLKSQIKLIEATHAV